MALSHSRSYGIPERTSAAAGRRMKTEAMDTVATCHHVDTVATYRHCRQGVGGYGMFLFRFSKFMSNFAIRVAPSGHTAKVTPHGQSPKKSIFPPRGGSNALLLQKNCYNYVSFVIID